tara:strand:- start:663 stop:941 length:279 start_codon:yes stop_codon:yes gene_type:complete
MILEIIIGILSLLVVILGYTTFNLLFKSEKSEDIIISQSKFIDDLSTQINESDKRLHEIDSKEIFKSDDEIGWFFDQIKHIQNNLNRFKIKE